jgi:hypothetical protein
LAFVVNGLQFRGVEDQFYINRAGKNLSAKERKTLEAAKTELRSLVRPLKG